MKKNYPEIAKYIQEQFWLSRIKLLIMGVNWLRTCIIQYGHSSFQAHLSQDFPMIMITMMSTDILPKLKYICYQTDLLFRVYCSPFFSTLLYFSLSSSKSQLYINAFSNVFSSCLKWSLPRFGNLHLLLKTFGHMPPSNAFIFSRINQASIFFLPQT